MLSQFVLSQLFAFLLVFCRMGSAMMLLPGFGEAYVAARFRLLLAFFFSACLTWAVKDVVMPATVAGMVILLVGEILTGLFMGALTRMLIGAVQIAGSIIAYQSSLSSSLTNDISSFQSQDTSIGNLLSVTAVVLIFVTDMHHLILRALADSYTLFIPGHFPIVEDFAQHAARTINGVFRMGLQLATPHVVVGMVLSLCAGVMARLMPNIQIFFLLLAPQILTGFFVLMIIISSLMLWYLDYFQEAFGAFLAH